MNRQKIYTKKGRYIMNRSIPLMNTEKARKNNIHINDMLFLFEFVSCLYFSVVTSNNYCT